MSHEIFPIRPGPGLFRWWLIAYVLRPAHAVLRNMHIPIPHACISFPSRMRAPPSRSPPVRPGRGRGWTRRGDERRRGPRFTRMSISPFPPLLTVRPPA
ncbi:hypothetical protein B0H14DRAFT_2740300 [Mycena olivaceomarginata]|nr:hypothetical protein B0H14DRAFT_2740300 [Mycena olivaceomarginata]